MPVLSMNLIAQAMFAQTTSNPMWKGLVEGTSVGGMVVRALAILAAGGLGLFLMLPRRSRTEGGAEGGRFVGAILATISLVLLVTAPVSAAITAGHPASLFWPLGNVPADVIFFTCAGISLVSALMMITSRNPVYSALWFAMVLLANSGLYFQQGAEFLAASTIIIYAGAIIVTFLFVVMLAQPMGAAAYDRTSREPLFSCIAGVLMASALLGTIHFSAKTEHATPGSRSVTSLPPVNALQTVGTPAEQASRWAIGNGPHVASLGRTLYLDHYTSVEAVGVLLLAAVVGAMLITSHKVEKPA